MKENFLKHIFLFFIGLFSSFTHADTEYVNVFTEALINGEARLPVPNQPELQAMVKHLQDQTKDSSPLIIQAHRVKRFQQQPRCGRVAFFIAQPGSGSVWSDIGGQFNICEDGTPPRRVCAHNFHELIPLGEKCPDKTEAQDTQEVKEAIRAALDGGGLNQEQIKNMLQTIESSP